MKIPCNCERSNADGHKLLDFVARQRRVHAEYGFWLSAQRRTPEEEARRREVFEKYGFTLNRKPVTPEEVEGRKRYERDMEKAERERHKDQIRAYNKEYRRRQRAGELAERMAKWSPEQIADYERRKAAKTEGAGTAPWLVSEVAKWIAAERG